MKQLTPEQILALLDAEDRDAEMVGCFETPTVDFKGEYRLMEKSQKWELAKDVSAFGNSGGGLIVVGVLTEPDEDRAEDKVVRVKPVPKDLFDPKQFQDTLKVWVYPPPEVDVVRHPRGDDKCLGTLHVRPRDGDDPYLVTRIPDDRDRFQENTGIGWPYRAGTHTRWKTVGQIHAALQQRNSPPTAHAEPVEPTAPVAPTSDIRPQSVAEIDSFMGWADRAFLYLIAHPENPEAELSGFFGPDPVLDAVRRPFSLRWAGFGLTYGSAETDLDGRIVSADEDRFLRVAPSGVLEAAASAGSDFLTRGGGHQNDPGPAAINPVVVTEWTYLYCRFLHNELIKRAPGVWNLTIGVHEAVSRSWSFTALPGRWTEQSSMRFLSDARPAGKNEWHHTIRPGDDPGQDAYRILAPLYSLFGLNYDDVGLAIDGRVQPDLIGGVR